jgi:hypothetical protein
MDFLTRTAKPGSDWRRHELRAYDITVHSVSPQEFFCPESEVDPPLTGLDPALINSPIDLEDTNMSDDAYRFLASLDLATNTSQETAIADFARELLRIVGFEERGHILRTRHSIPFSICDSFSMYGKKDAQAQADVCLVDRRSAMILLLQVNTTLFSSSDPEPQVIAGAIAAYQYNNARRKRMGLHTLSTMTIPCITMVGTCPTFYLVPVTQQLSDAVINGNRPNFETKVFMCATAADRHRRLSEGMEVPEYRRVAFQHMIAFKAIAKCHWEKSWTPFLLV